MCLIGLVMKKFPDNPFGVGVPGWPRWLSIECAAEYLSRTTGFVEARLRAGGIPFHIKDAEERVIDRLELDRWIAKQPTMIGKLRHCEISVPENTITTRAIFGRHANRTPFPAPHWCGEARPHGARRVRLHSRFPPLGYLAYLVSELGYDGSAAFAAMVQAHQPWLRTVDLHRANPIDADKLAVTEGHQLTPIASLVHPYIPAAPGRRTKVGGGLTKEQVRQALGKKRWDKRMKEAVFEIVYRRRSNLQVSNESGIPVETLYVYASRVRKEIREADLHVLEKAA